MQLIDCVNKKIIKIISPNAQIANSFLEQADNTLSNIIPAIEEKDYLWASVKIYYAAYYSLCAFLWLVGLKSENHDCSIKIIAYLLEDNEIFDKVIKLKKSRIDNQYYLNISDEKSLKENYEITKKICIRFHILCRDFDERYRKKASKIRVW